MLKLKRILIVGLTLSVVLTACSSTTPASTSVPPSLSSLPQPTLPPAIRAPTPEPVSVGVPVIEFLNERSVLLVISSVTGKVFDTFTPIPLGENYNYAFAPDGHTLALVSNARLYLIDLPSWKISTFVVGLYGWLVYSPDGTLLALASGGSDGNLRVVDARSGEVKASAQEASPSGMLSSQTMEKRSWCMVLILQAQELPQMPGSASARPKRHCSPSQI